MVGGMWLLVFAGARKDPPTGVPGAREIAAVRVMTAPNDHTAPHVVGTYDDPEGDGHSLRITAVAGSMVTLQRDDGETLTFNLKTHQFAP